MKTRFMKLLSISISTQVACALAVLLGTPGRGGAATPATATLPFKLEVVEVSKSTLPALHSFSSATANGRWLIIGGRTGGLHGFGSGNNNFPRSTANIMAYVIDPAANKVLGSVNLVQALPPRLAGPLTATNPEFLQAGTHLFIVGGYGKDLQSLQTNDMTTFGSIIQVDVAGLMQAIIKKTPIASYFVQNPNPDNRLKVAGGGLKQFKGIFYLVLGQDFTGHYSVDNLDYNRAGGQFQKYTEKVRMFSLNGDLSINQFQQFDGGYDPNLPYHRRDLNVVDIIQPDGATPGVTVYGGVFKAGQVAGHTTPIDINFPAPGTTVTMFVRSNFIQGLNHYDCPDVTIFDQTSGSSFTTLLGGISQFRYDMRSNTLVRDQVDLAKGVDGLPFIKTVSTIQHGPNAAFAQFIQPAPLPAMLGTDGQFLHNPKLQSGGQIFDNGVIKLAALRGRTLVGHMYGGIESGGSYSGLVTNNPSTWASSRLFRIYVTPGTTKVMPMPPVPATATPYVPVH
jgi:hypothetical protein